MINILETHKAYRRKKKHPWILSDARKPIKRTALSSLLFEKREQYYSYIYWHVHESLLAKHRFLSKTTAIGYKDFLKYTIADMDHVVEREVEYQDKIAAEREKRRR